VWLRVREKGGKRELEKKQYLNTLVNNPHMQRF
jgi:hypothetical protein